MGISAIMWSWSWLRHPTKKKSNSSKAMTIFTTYNWKVDPAGDWITHPINMTVNWHHPLSKVGKLNSLPHSPIFFGEAGYPLGDPVKVPADVGNAEPAKMQVLYNAPNERFTNEKPGFPQPNITVLNPPIGFRYPFLLDNCMPSDRQWQVAKLIDVSDK